MVDDIASECQPMMELEHAIRGISGEDDIILQAGADADNIDLSALAAAMLGFGKRQIPDGKLPSKF